MVTKININKSNTISKQTSVARVSTLQQEPYDRMKLLHTISMKALKGNVEFKALHIDKNIQKDRFKHKRKRERSIQSFALTPETRKIARCIVNGLQQAHRPLTFEHRKHLNYCPLPNLQTKHQCDMKLIQSTHSQVHNCKQHDLMPTTSNIVNGPRQLINQVPFDTAKRTNYQQAQVTSASAALEVTAVTNTPRSSTLSMDSVDYTYDRGYNMSHQYAACLPSVRSNSTMELPVLEHNGHHDVIHWNKRVFPVAYFIGARVSRVIKYQIWMHGQVIKYNETGSYTVVYSIGEHEELLVHELFGLLAPNILDNTVYTLSRVGTKPSKSWYKTQHLF